MFVIGPETTVRIIIFAYYFIVLASSLLFLRALYGLIMYIVTTSQLNNYHGLENAKCKIEMAEYVKDEDDKKRAKASAKHELQAAKNVVTKYETKRSMYIGYFWTAFIIMAVLIFAGIIFVLHNRDRAIQQYRDSNFDNDIEKELNDLGNTPNQSNDLYNDADQSIYDYDYDYNYDYDNNIQNQLNDLGN